MNKRNDCLYALSGYTTWIPVWHVYKNHSWRLKGNVKTASQMQHVSAHKKLMRASSLLMDESKLPSFFCHVFIHFYCNKLKTTGYFKDILSSFNYFLTPLQWSMENRWASFISEINQQWFLQLNGALTIHHLLKSSCYQMLPIHIRVVLLENKSQNAPAWMETISKGHSWEPIKFKSNKMKEFYRHRRPLDTAVLFKRHKFR